MEASTQEGQAIQAGRDHRGEPHPCPRCLLGQVSERRVSGDREGQAPRAEIRTRRDHRCCERREANVT